VRAAFDRRGAILHYDGDTWTARDSGTSDDLTGVWGSLADEVFVVGEPVTILHYGGER
jgi:hypothetical protein